jgi:hypothetical protein
MSRDLHVSFTGSTDFYTAELTPVLMRGIYATGCWLGSEANAPLLAAHL